jgi:maltooligosyltrehalose trehalohydrolase
MTESHDVPLGAHLTSDGTRFAAYASEAQRCAVRLFDRSGGALATLEMSTVAPGLFVLDTAEAGAGSLYKFVLDGRELPDPYARYLPQGVHGPAQVMGQGYAFRHENVYRPLTEHVFYELHVGTFTERGTFRAAMERLPELVELGATAVELMPVAAFAGARGWGYDGVALFAPHAAYGTPDDLRALVDHAHGLGLSVFLDVVYNHLGPSGNYLSAYSPHYFTHAYQNAWGDAPNFAHPAMRTLALSNLRYWLQSFRFDGLRLDAVHAIYDPSPVHISEELVRAAKAVDPRTLVIAEDDRNEPNLVTRTGFDAIWADDFHHAVHVLLTGERDGYYAAYAPELETLSDTLQHGWLYRGQRYAPWGKPRGQPAQGLSPHHFVYNIQNHDQVGNRALGERLNHLVSIDAYCLASTLLLFLPTTPLLFMGQEWAASSPFLYFTDHDPDLGRLVSEGRREEFKLFAAFSDPAVRAQIPDPQDAQTFARSKLRWDERAHAPHARVHRLYKALLALRRSDPVLRHAPSGPLHIELEGGLLRITRAHAGERRLLLANFASAPLSAPCAGTLLLASSAAADAGTLAPYAAHIYALPGSAGRD